MGAVNYKCPACGAGIAFDIETQKWDCKFCGSQFDETAFKAAQSGDGKTKPEDEPQYEAQSRERETFESAVKFSCPSCGGEIITDENTAATFCVYCHNPAIISQRVSDEYRPELLIPFLLKRDYVLDALRKYCARRPLLPRDFRQYAEKGEISGLYVPFWLYSARLDADIQAEGSRITAWSDTKYRYTKIDVYAVRRVADVKFKSVPADGSSRMDDKLMEQLEPYDYKKLRDFDPAFLSGHFAERYDVDDKQSRKRAVPRMQKSAEKSVMATITGFDSVRVISSTANPAELTSKYALLPVWVLMGEYRGKRYTFAMNGQTGKIAGNLPLSFSRAMLWLGTAGIGAALLAFLGMMFL